MWVTSNTHSPIVVVAITRLSARFQKGKAWQSISSPSLLESARRYIAQEKDKARALADQLNGYEGVLVWGAGDNFYRSSENSGPLSGLSNMIVLDRRPQEYGARQIIETVNPQEGIRCFPWPVAVTVSEGRESISERIAQIDPFRRVFFI